MSVLELPTVTGARWVVWEPLTTGDLLTVVLGMTALTLATIGLWQMRTASAARNRQLDAQTETLTRQSATLARQSETLARHSETLAVLVRGLETVIERTAPGAGKETA